MLHVGACQGAVSDITGYSVVKQNDVLINQRNLLTQVIQGIVSQGHAVQVNLAIGRMIKTRQQAHQCCLPAAGAPRSEEHTSELQSRGHLVCRLLLEKKNK